MLRRVPVTIRLPDSLDRALIREPIRVIDVGARGGWPPAWRRFRRWVTLVGFEPEREEWERLARGARPNEVYLQEALYRAEGEATLHHTRDPSCSSLYPPNRELIRRLRPGDRRLDVVGREPISVTTLDAALGRAGMLPADFVKLDTQGSELDILAGAPETLAGPVIAVEVEVEFLPIYEGQPLFDDMHRYMTKRGFSLLDFRNPCSVADFRAGLRRREETTLKDFFTRVRNTLALRTGTARGSRPLLYADAIYLRDRDAFLDAVLERELDPDALLARAVLTCAALGCYEHAFGLIEAASSRRLIAGETSARLERAVTAVARSLPALAGDLLRLAGRLGRRLRLLAEGVSP